MSRSVTIKLPELPKRLKGKRRLGILFILCGLALLYFFWKDAYVFVLYRDDDVRQVQRLVLDVQGLAVLPSDETPGLATITDKTKLNQGGVLANAENGDKILLYYKAGRAVVYRPGAGRVVAIGPLVLDASAAQVKDTKVLVRNGSGSKDKLDSTLALLNERYSEADIAKPEDASRSDFPKTIVIDLTEKGEKNEFVGAMVELLGAQRGILPQGESKPNADVLVIIGKD